MRCLCPLAFLAACTFTGPIDVDAGGGGDDSGGGGDFIVLEELMVPATGGAVTSTNMLRTGIRYRLRARGTIYVDLQIMADAEFWRVPEQPEDVISTVDVGLAVNDPTIDNIRTPRWGAYRNTHIYEVEWVGNGGPIVAQFHDGNFTTNSGMLTLEILARQ
jgi:hypothetical protein